MSRADLLETERLLLEPWDERHRSVWRLICRDREVMRFIGRGELWDETRADAVFDEVLAHWRRHDFGWRSALDRENGDWLGFVGLNYVGSGIDGIAPAEVEIGWWLIPATWGRGYATEGAMAVRDEGFARVSLQQIIARLQPANIASARIAQKIGMRRAREAVGREGTPLHVYVLDRADWTTPVLESAAPRGKQADTAFGRRRHAQTKCPG